MKRVASICTGLEVLERDVFATCSNVRLLGKCIEHLDTKPKILGTRK